MESYLCPVATSILKKSSGNTDLKSRAHKLTRKPSHVQSYPRKNISAEVANQWPMDHIWNTDMFCLASTEF